MTFRLAAESDQEKINSLCDEKSLPHPILNICFIAESEDGQLVGYVNAGFVGFMESFVSDNAMSAHTLFAMMEGALKSHKIAPVFAGVINPDAGELLVRLGYEEIKDSKFYLRRK